MMFGSSYDFTNFSFRTNITRVNPQTVCTRISNCQRNFIVKVNVCHQRHRYLLSNFTKCSCGFHGRYRNTHDVYARIYTTLNLRHSCSNIAGFRIGHTLDADGRITTHIDRTHTNFTGRTALNWIYNHDIALPCCIIEINGILLFRSQYMAIMKSTHCSNLMTQQSHHLSEFEMGLRLVNLK